MMKKNLNTLFALLLAMGLFFTACDDVSLDKPEMDEATATDATEGLAISSDVFAIVHSGTTPGKAASNCPAIEYLPLQNTMVITYPADGCEDGNGVLKAGIIRVAFTRAWAVGAEATITFDGYKVDGRTLTGTITSKYISAGDNPVFQLNASNMLLTFKDQRTLRWDSENTITLMGAGAKKITGVSEGVGRSGKNFKRVATELLTAVDCKWFVSGVIELTIGEDDKYKMEFDGCGNVTYTYKGITIQRTL